MPFTSKVLLVRPSRFGYNPETVGSNAFQRPPLSDGDDVSKKALEEFDRVADGLANAGVDVVTVADSPEPYTPDAVFPNNWFSTHPDGTLCLYPMEAEARKHERVPAHIEVIKARCGTERIIDLSHYEKSGRSLEGTGSLVIDHSRRLAYACVSSRTDPGLVSEWAELTGHSTMVFKGLGPDGRPLYHTNVMMSLGIGFAVVCLSAVPDKGERRRLTDSFEDGGRRVLEIDEEQMAGYAGNIIQLVTSGGEPLLAMSESARRSLGGELLSEIAGHTDIVSFAIPMIERCGGGSLRCMTGELFEGGS